MEATQVNWLQANGFCAPYICTSFKQQAIQRDINKLKNAQGEIQMAWSELAKISKLHFSNLVRTQVALSKFALKEVLQAQIGRISEEACRKWRIILA